MAKKKPTKAKKTKKPASKKKPKTKKALSPQQKKLEIIGAYLDEIFHLVGHSIEAGTEAVDPWNEILTAMVFLHNQLEDKQDHLIQSVTLACECEEKAHTIQTKDFIDTCEG